MWGFHDGMGWWMVFGGIWMVVFWALVVGLVVWGVRSLGVARAPSSEGPRQIAERRYALGEISREQLEEIRGTLRKA